MDRDSKMNTDSISKFLVENDHLLVQSFYTGLLLLIWVWHIFPLLKLEDVELQIAIAIAGYVWFSLISFLVIIPYWFSSLTFWTIEMSYIFGLKVHRRIVCSSK